MFKSRMEYHAEEVLGSWEVRDSEGRLCWLAESEERADAVASFLNCEITHPGTKAWIERHQQEVSQ